jgi:flagellar hook-length control protein FliK
LTPVNGVTPSKGGDARRSRDEAGAAEQPSRLAPAANEPSAAQTAAVQDPSANELGAAASAPQAQPQAQPSVRLAELAKAAQTAITVTSQNGGTTARIVLHPAELGSVQIHLRYSSDGVTATIRADSPQAAQVLHEAAPDLRRALEGQGLSLLDLDVHDQSGGSPADRDPGSTGGNAGSAPDVPEDSETLTGVALDPAYLPSPGSQIDVLA